MRKVDAMAEDAVTKEEILAAIRRAGAELGRAPSRGELRRITGLSHYRVLAEFPTLREAVRAAGLEPNPKGEKISTEDLLQDWKRVAEKLGRRPSRAEYVREGKYSAGALTVRFGSWGRISTTEDTEKHREKKSVHNGGTETQRTARRPVNRKAEEQNLNVPATPRERQVKNDDQDNAMRWAASLAQVPTPLVGMRRVTEAVAQMVVNTLLAPGNWQLAISQKQNPFTTEVTEEHGGEKSSRELTRRTRIGEEELAGNRLAARGIRREGDLGPSLAVNAPLPFDSPFGSAQGFGLRPQAESGSGLRPAAKKDDGLPPHH